MNEAPIIVEPSTPPKGVCIWLHGLGADGHDFEPLVRPVSRVLPIRFILPHAPVRPVTINGGAPMRAWFDIASAALDERVDVDGIAASAQAVAALARSQSLPVILGGFSQGGLVALHAGLHLGVSQAVAALSTWYPLAVPANRLDVFMAHGEQDPIVPLALAERSRDVLEAAGAQVAWQNYPMPHSVCEREWADLNAWLDARMEVLCG